MEVAFFDAHADEEQFLREQLKEHDCVFFPEPLSLKSAAQAAHSDVVSIFVSSQMPKEAIDALPSLKCIATRSTGFDHVDVAYAKQKGIAVCTVPSYGARTVAEFTFGLMLNLSRKIFKARLQMLQGGRFEPGDLRGFDLFGKTLGVVGTGKIGKNVIRIASAFGMKILASDPYPDQNFATEMKFQYVTLAELLAQSDIVSLHVPSTKETHHLINAENIFTMKKSALLINTARGDLVETDALVRALMDGHLGGAGLDVLENEQELREEAELLARTPEKLQDFKLLFEDHLLMDRPDVILTPHIAFDTTEAVREILQTTADNIRAFANGQKLNTI